MSLFCSLQLIKTMHSEINKNYIRCSPTKKNNQKNNPSLATRLANTRLFSAFGLKENTRFEHNNAGADN